MADIFPVKQSLFVNRQAQAATQTNDAVKNTNGSSPAVIEGEYIKIGDFASFSQAKSLFETANQFASLSNNAQNGLQAYTALDAQNKRDELKRLMGVDLYA